MKLGYRPSNGYFHGLAIPSFFQSNMVRALGAYTGNSDFYMINQIGAPVMDQGGLSSCTAFGTCGSLEILRSLINPPKFQQLSRLFVYWNSRNYIQETNIDEGSFIHLAFQSIQSLGVCEDALYPYVENQVYAQPNLLSYKEGNSNAITAFYNISSSGAQKLSDVESAVRANHPVVFGVQVGSDFENYDGSNKVFDPPSSSNGGHCMIIVGVRTGSQGTKDFLVKNQWGTFWGIPDPLNPQSGRGYVWLSSNYILSAEDLFVPTFMNDLLT
jgi:C1A family cysteine protease